MPIWHIDALRRPLDFSQELSQVLYQFPGRNCPFCSLKNTNVFNQRKYSSIVATKCQPAAIYDLLWISVSNQIETVALFRFQTQPLSDEKIKRESEGRQTFFH